MLVIVSYTDSEMYSTQMYPQPSCGTRYKLKSLWQQSHIGITITLAFSLLEINMLGI
jgi:hypothetical protein